MTPTPPQIRAAPESARPSPKAAPALIYKTRGAWAQWEARESASNHRAMDPAFWELFLLKTKQKSPE